ncbi:MAG: transporter [Rhizobiaceae bacterium]|nr:transporter [Rhizobiaceae bacterium]
MLPAETVQSSLLGAWRMMMGKADGIRLLDLTADGFWNSFYAILLAMPALAVNWVPVANDTLGPDVSIGVKLGYVFRLAIVDIGAWILPLVVLALISGLAGIRDRFVHYVVATNWATVPIVWIMLPPSLLALFVPEAGDAVTALALVLFLVTMVLTWRVTNAALGKGAAIATGVFVGMFVGSILIMLLLQSLVGIEVPIG